MVRHNGGSAAQIDLSREQVEQLARERAERLLTPAARAQENTPDRPAPRPPEPTLEERLAAIDRRWAAYAQQQRTELVTDLLDQARRRFAAAVAATPDEQVRAAAAAMAHAERLA